jgi:hypothetical protein
MIQWLEGEISAVEREAPVKAPGAMSTEPVLVLHRFVALTNEADCLALGWMRERPLKPPVQNDVALRQLPACRAALRCCVRRPVASCAAPLRGCSDD